MLPFDNKSEFQVIVNMPEGTALEETQRVVALLAREAMAQPEVVDAQTYAGTASPHNFNRLVRHYYLRSGANVADIQLNLLSKADRKQQSHEIAKQVRVRLAPLAATLGAKIQVAEVPPGPPVLATLVAGVYGPTQQGQKQVAAELLEIFGRTRGVVDADWYVEEEQPKKYLRVDCEKAGLHGIAPAAIADAVRLATMGSTAGLLHQELEQESVPIVMRLNKAERVDLDRIRRIRVPGANGAMVVISEFTTVVDTREERNTYHKNLMPVT